MARALKDYSSSQKAIAFSVGIHLLLLLLLLLVKDDSTIEVLFQVRFTPLEEAIPEREKVEIRKQIKKVQKQKKLRQRNKKQSPQNTRPQPRQKVDSQEQFVRDFEKTLHTKKKSSFSTPTGKRKKYAWAKTGNAGNPKGKATARENVKIPRGRVGSGKVRWVGENRTVLSSPKPIYPKAYRKRAIQAVAVVGLEVDAAGKVLRTWIERSSGHPKLDILAKNAARRARISQGTRRSKGSIEYTWNLK